MDIQLDSARKLVVENVVDSRDVDTTGCDIGGDESAMLLGAEPLQVLEALPLLHLGVHWVHRATQEGEDGHNPSETVDRVYEDDGLSLVSLQQIVEVEVLEEVSN